MCGPEVGELEIPRCRCAGTSSIYPALKLESRRVEAPLVISGDNGKLSMMPLTVLCCRTMLESVEESLQQQPCSR